MRASQPVFAVSDVGEAIRFYRDVLGFESEWLWGDPPVHGGIRWNEVQVMFHKNPAMAANIEGHGHYFVVDDVRRLYQQHQSSGAPIITDLEDQPWGISEYVVRDINGYHLVFAGDRQRHVSVTDSLPPYIALEKRIVAPSDYERLKHAVQWNVNPSMTSTVLERTLFGIAAKDARDGLTVGMLRVCGDGQQFTIWDVVVIPSYQGQKIGSAMMEMAMSELRRIALSGTPVWLFTRTSSFYEHFGFKVDVDGMRTTL
jgi:uncharacterized glyoxalase superfamily protein PhnB